MICIYIYIYIICLYIYIYTYSFRYLKHSSIPLDSIHVSIVLLFGVVPTPNP